MFVEGAVMADSPPARRKAGSAPTQPQKTVRLPKERAEFKRLVATNPNYFGNLSESEFEPVKVIAEDTAYEQLTCIGFNPQLNMLEGIVQIKLPQGYDGSLCFAGSTEYVRFYIDYGGGWQDLGLA